MNAMTFIEIIEKYKKCPSCGATSKSADLQANLENEIITFSCKCGWSNLKKITNK